MPALRSLLPLVAVTLLVLLAAARDEKELLRFKFTNVAREAGLTATTIYGGRDTNQYLLETTGTGVAVIDYDSARLLPRIIDIANGALQFSIIGGDEDVLKWPDYPDESRFKRFLRGYDEVMLLSQAEIRAIPPLMPRSIFMRTKV